MNCFTYYVFYRDKYIPESMKIQVKEIAETYLEEIMFGLSTKVQ